MPTTAVVLGSVAAGLILAGCGNTQSDSPTAAEIADGEPSLTCGVGPTFRPSALVDGVPGLVDEDEVAQALDDMRADFGIDAPRPLQSAPASEAGWEVLGGDQADDPQSIIVSVGAWDPRARHAGVYVALERTADGWDPQTWGDCNLEPVLADDVSWVDVVAPPGGVDPTKSTVDVMISERECTSGRDPQPYLHEPVVVELPDTVTVYWTSDAPEGDQTCQGNPLANGTLSLVEPLGNRTLLDGSTWLPTPIRSAVP